VKAVSQHPVRLGRSCIVSCVGLAEHVVRHSATWISD
jgi:hypothetical protein